MSINCLSILSPSTRTDFFRGFGRWEPVGANQPTKSRTDFYTGGSGNWNFLSLLRVH